MPTILPLSEKLRKKIIRHNLQKKWDKQLQLFTHNPAHPGLNTELLVPKEYGIYSFRIDRTFRALFVYQRETKNVEIIGITVHYK